MSAAPQLQADQEPTPTPARSTGARGARRTPRAAWIGKTLKVIRRVHLYLGLVLLPFVLIFGLSGVLFNHAGVGRDRQERALAPGEVALDTWDAEALARQLVERLNAGEPGRYTLDPAEPGRLFGPSIFLSQQPDGSRVMVSLRLDEGSATVAEMPPAEKPATPAFAGEKVELEGHSVAAVQPQVSRLLESLGMDGKRVRPHPRPPPEVRFRVQEAGGPLWNVSWSSGTGELTARAADAGSGGWADTMMRLHKLHHYPTHPSVTWLWILFADLTGISMILWALTGMVMWWQLKPTRLVGVLALVVALLVGVGVYVTSAAEIGFTG